MKRNRSTYRRLWEIDTVRGIAVVLMVFYHFVFDLHFFGANISFDQAKDIGVGSSLYLA